MFLQGMWKHGKMLEFVANDRRHSEVYRFPSVDDYTCTLRVLYTMFTVRTLDCITVYPKCLACISIASAFLVGFTSSTNRTSTTRTTTWEHR
jgi:hypothetical protein